MENGVNPTDCLIAFAHRAPRCFARNRAGKPCQSPAMKGRKRCRLHGGLSPGAPTGAANGRYVHGRRTKAHRETMAYFKALAAEI